MDLLAHTPVALLALILGFGFLIFVHELGHFLVARAVGIKCTQFAIGFGPSMLTWRKGIGFRVGTTEPEYEKRLKEGADPATLGETEYRLNYLPLGGYVKMLGQEDLDPNAQSTDPRAFNRKPVWARACVISAGVVMNLIFGLVFLVAAFMAGVEFPPALVGGTQPTSPADTTYARGHEGDPDYLGLEVGDHITHVDGEQIVDFMELRLAAALGRSDTPITLTVDRPGEDEPLVYRMAPQRDPQENLLSLGITPIASLELGVAEDDPLYEAGARDGMRVVAVNGEPVDDFHAFYEALQTIGPESFEATLEHPDTGERAEVTLPGASPRLMAARVDDTGVASHLVGLMPAAELFPGEDSPAAEAGVEAGDVLAELDGQPWPRVHEVSQIVKAASDEGLTARVWRDGELVDLPEPIQPERDMFAAQAQIGVALQPATSLPVIAGALAESPAAGLSLPVGSRIVELAGQAVDDWADMQQALIAAARDAEADAPLSVEVTYELNIAGSPRESATLELDSDTVASLPHLEWASPGELNRHLLMRRERVAGENPLEATLIGLDKTKQFMQQTYLTLLRLIQRSIGFDQLRGPVGIVDEGTRVAAEGWPYLFFFLGLISINLAIVNFLPIPIVDGGLMVFLIIEKLKGSPAGPKVQTAATLAGLALIGFVFITVTFYDIVRLAGG